MVRPEIHSTRALKGSFHTDKSVLLNDIPQFFIFVACNKLLLSYICIYWKLIYICTNFIGP